MTEAAGGDDQLVALQRTIESLLLGGPRKYTSDEAVARSGVPADRAAAFWRALGFPASEDEVLFTDADVESLRSVNELIMSGILDPDTAIANARLMGQQLSRIAEWHVEIARSVVGANPELVADERQMRRFAERLVPDIAHQLDYVWRRHLAAFAGRLLAMPDELEARNQVVGFADMVGFTTLTRRASESELSTLVDRFDSLTAEVVAENHGRIVKMLGDEVLFVADTPAHGARIALTLQDRAEADDAVPALRAGLAYGRVLLRFGDIYGSVVNIASRLTSVARPGTVLVDAELAEALADDPAFAVRHRRPVSVRGYSRLRPSVLRWSADEPRTLRRSAAQAAAQVAGDLLLSLVSEGEAPAGAGEGDQPPSVPEESRSSHRERR